MAATTEAIEATAEALEEHPESGHGHVPSTFTERYQTALHNKRLARNITRYQKGWRANRDASLEEVEFERLRAALKAAKTRVHDNFDTYLNQFKEQAERAGTHIHFAADADQANQIVLDIARQHDVKAIAKSKSMVSEEIDLNHRFHDYGIETVETDLGEWIVQLA